MKLDYEKLIDEYCLFDNDFMRKCLQERPECAELILKIILLFFTQLLQPQLNCGLVFFSEQRKA